MTNINLILMQKDLINFKTLFKKHLFDRSIIRLLHCAILSKTTNALL